MELRGTPPRMSENNCEGPIPLHVDQTCTGGCSEMNPSIPGKWWRTAPRARLRARLLKLQTSTLQSRFNKAFSRPAFQSGGRLTALLLKTMEAPLPSAQVGS